MQTKRTKPGKVIEKTYEAFVAKTAAKLRKTELWSEAEARKAAEEMCAMYRHHFRQFN